jgi:hypothetical protein
MIFPEPRHSPFNGEGDFRSQVLQYIRTRFAGFLGEDVKLLDQPDGLDLLQAKYPLRKTELLMELRAELADIAPTMQVEKREIQGIAAA